MANGFLVIGLGTFGFQTASALYRQGAEVLAVDYDQDAIERISERVTRAVCVDALNEEALKEVGAFDLEMAIIALRRHFDTSVLVTHMLRRRDFKQILVQVDSSREGDAIRAVGATGTIFPERDMAERIARKLMVPDLADQIPLGGDVSIIEIACPREFVGKSLLDLGLRKQYGVTVIALKSRELGSREEKVQVAPSPEEPLEKNQTLVFLGRSDLLSRFKERVTK
ncbi:TrkA family potassium uptake protein [bacterium]|nr:TrkA family potassium uptake protein [bacterium]